MIKQLRQLAIGAAGVVLTVTLAGCGSDDAPAAAGPTDTGAPASGAATQASGLTVTDPWVKAADSGMAAAFGTLENGGAGDAEVVSASSDAGSTMELHETVQNTDGSTVMRPKDGGFTVPAGGEHTLAPGGDHLMMMGLTRPLRPGELVTITLTLGDGSTLEVDAIVKEFSGAEENYQGGGDTGMGDQGMGDQGMGEE